MAFVDVEIPEGGEGGEYFKFNAIGDRLVGVFVSKAMGQAGEYQGRPIPARLEYVFRTREGNVTVSPPTKLAMGFERADLKPGHRVIATFTGEIAATKPGHSAIKVFKLQVDRDPPAAGAAAAPKPPPPPPKPALATPGGEFDDIPFLGAV